LEGRGHGEIPLYKRAADARGLRRSVIVLARVTGDFPGSPRGLALPLRARGRQDWQVGDHGMTFDLELASFAFAGGISTLPLRQPPSAMTSRGDGRSPVIEPVACSSMRSRAVTLPVIAPIITTAFATIDALMVACGAMLSVWLGSEIVPSNWPWSI